MFYCNKKKRMKQENQELQQLMTDFQYEISGNSSCNKLKDRQKRYDKSLYTTNIQQGP